MMAMFLKVQTYSGYKADERPVSFTLGDKTCKVVEIVDRWYGPDYTNFKLFADDGNIYVLRHRMEDDRWEMILMEAGNAPERT